MIIGSVSPSWVGGLGEVSLSVTDCESVKSQLQKASTLPYGKSRRYDCGEFARRHAAVVKKEDSRSGLWSRQKVGSDLPIGCKKDAELLGPQRFVNKGITWSTMCLHQTNRESTSSTL